MKKILKTVLSAAILCLTAVIMSVCVSAETEAVEYLLAIRGKYILRTGKEPEI